MKARILRFTQLFAIAVIGVLVVLLTEPLSPDRSVHALPEYVDRTGESCATCHVNPGGGGPRTLRGLLWAAQGRPDEIPQLGSILIAPGVNDGVELYDTACASCHGTSGEGSFGVALSKTGLNIEKINLSILRGWVRSGMPSFDGQFTEAQLEALAEYVQGISSGVIEPAPLSYPLPPARFECVENLDGEACGGN
jgi:mono/diheme cytochrome c family protein